MEEKSIKKCVSREELTRLAVKGSLFWQEKKIALDPFTEVDYQFEVMPDGDGFRLLCMSGGEVVTQEMVFPLGLLRNGIFRFWKEGKPPFIEETVCAMELERRVAEGYQITGIENLSSWKEEPVPCLALQDRTGAFAALWIDYGRKGKSLYRGVVGEKGFEQDLLETDFIRKPPIYYCPMDKVVQSLSFLLDVGWNIVDVEGRKVVRPGNSLCHGVEQGEFWKVEGVIEYEGSVIDLQPVLEAFRSNQRFVDLSPDTVGLISLPSQWRGLVEESITSNGIEVRRCHIGLLEGVVSLPATYQTAYWERVSLGSSFQGVLFEYQQDGVNWLSYLYRCRFAALLADEMGLGKTVQVIAFLSTLTVDKPILLVMPSSLLFHWKKELQRFVPERFSENEVVLISYGQLRAHRAYYQSIEYSVVILDEAQAIKNEDTATAHAAYSLRASFRVAITGTPVENRQEELWSIFRFLMPELLGERKEGIGVDRIRKKIRPFTLRRRKQEVDLVLPEKEEQIIWIGLDPEHRECYDQYLRKQRAALLEKAPSRGVAPQRMEILTLLLRLRQICCHPILVEGDYQGPSSKFERVCEDLLEVMGSGYKVVLYSQFTSLLKLFRRWVEERSLPYAYLDGDTQNREKEVEAFQEDPHVQLLLSSLKVGGVGLNLQAADYVFLYDPWWNRAVEKQAIDRAHRLGRKGRVIARKYLAVHTIEEKILQLQQQKERLFEQLLEFDEEMIPFSFEELFALIEEDF